MAKKFVLDANRKKILIVEDDRNVADLVGVVLRGRGFATILAADGEVALVSALYYRPDAILLDLNMPEMGGFAFLEHRREFEDLKRIPIIVLTASRQIEDVKRAMALGAIGYVAKPLQVTALLERLEKHVPSPLFGRRDSTIVSWPLQTTEADSALGIR